MTHRCGNEEDIFQNDQSQSSLEDEGKLKKNFFDFEDDEAGDLMFEADFRKPKSEKPAESSKEPNVERPNLFELKFTESAMAKLVGELSEVRYNYSNLASPTTTAITPRVAIERLLSGDDTVNLSVFRGKESKLELLDYALLTGNTYAISRTILFLQQTLKPSIFFYEITRRPIAADHYLAHLRNTEQLDTLLEALTMLGRNEDAAFAVYSRAVRSKPGENQLKSLHKALSNFFTSGGNEVLQWQPYIKDHIALLELQLPIETDDHRRESEESKNESPSENHSNLFVIFPRPSLLSLPLLETLHYCCLYHYHLQDNNFASPVNLKKRFTLSEKQFLCIALSALAKCGLWTEIDNLFEYKSWLGSRKIKTTIPTEHIVRTLYKCSAPMEMLEKYVDLLDDTELKLQLAKEFRLTKLAADILIKTKDRKRLSELRATLQAVPNFDYVQQHIENALRNSQIKWKN